MWITKTAMMIILKHERKIHLDIFPNRFWLTNERVCHFSFCFMVNSNHNLSLWKSNYSRTEKITFTPFITIFLLSHLHNPSSLLRFFIISDDGWSCWCPTDGQEKKTHTIRQVNSYQELQTYFNSASRII